MAIAQIAFRTRRTSNRSRLAAASKAQRAEMPLFQAFLRPSSVKVTDGLCIKDSTTIDDICGTDNFWTNTNNDRIVKVERGNAKYMEVNT